MTRTFRDGTLGGVRSSRLLLPLVLLRQAYPANHAPRVEVAGELVLIAVARNQHDDAPIVYVLQVDGGCGTQIAGEDFGGLDHHLLPIHASGIFPSNSDALGLSLSIMASPSDRYPPASVGYLYRQHA